MKNMKEIASRNLPGTTANIKFKTSYPPMEPTKANYALLDQMEAVNLALGYGKLEALDPSKRGGGGYFFCGASYGCILSGHGSRWVWRPF